MSDAIDELLGDRHLSGVLETVTDALARQLIEIGACSVMADDDAPDSVESDPLCGYMLVAMTVAVIIVLILTRRWK